MALLVAVIAESQVARGNRGSGAVSSEVSGLATGVADALVRTIAGCMAWFLTVPTQGSCGAF